MWCVCVCVYVCVCGFSLYKIIYTSVACESTFRENYI